MVLTVSLGFELMFTSSSGSQLLLLSFSKGETVELSEKQYHEELEKKTF